MSGPPEASRPRPHEATEGAHLDEGQKEPTGPHHRRRTRRRQGRQLDHVYRDGKREVLVVQRHDRGGVRLLVLGEKRADGTRMEIAWVMLRREELRTVRRALSAAIQRNEAEESRP